MLPVFYPICLRPFDFPILGSEENKVPPIISRELVKALRFSFMAQSVLAGF